MRTRLQQCEYEDTQSSMSDLRTSTRCAGAMGNIYQYEGTYTVVSRHMYSSMRTHMQQYLEDFDEVRSYYYMCPQSTMCPHTHRTVCPQTKICFLILLYMCKFQYTYFLFLYYYYANIILYACLEGGCRSSVRTMNFSKFLLKYEKNLRWGTTRHTSTYVPSYSYYYICVLILLYVSSYY